MCSTYTGACCQRHHKQKKKRQHTDPCNKYVHAIDAAITVVSKLGSSKMKIAIELEELLMPVAVFEIGWSSANTMVTIIYHLVHSKYIY